MKAIRSRKGREFIKLLLSYDADPDVISEVGMGYYFAYAFTLYVVVIILSSVHLLMYSSQHEETHD